MVLLLYSTFVNIFVLCREKKKGILWFLSRVEKQELPERERDNNNTNVGRPPNCSGRMSFLEYFSPFPIDAFSFCAILVRNELASQLAIEMKNWAQG